MFRKILPAVGIMGLIGAIVFNAHAQQKVTVDKVVAVVGNSAILYSEVDQTARTLREERRRQGYTSDRDPYVEALETLMTQKLLYNQALVDSVEIHMDYVYQMVENEVDRMVQEAGSIGELQKRQGKPIYDIREDLRIRLEEQSYAQAMQREVMGNVRVTPGEVDRFFRRLPKDSLPMIPEQYVYAQITKYPTNTQVAKQRVRERLLELRERVINGERFDVLARMYSSDPGTAMQGGEMDFMPLNALVKPFADALSKLQPGQISEVVETEFGFHIIQMVEKRGDLYKCRHILLKPIFTPEELVESDRFLDSLANQIRLDSITFEKAAMLYSDDRYSKQNGGIVTNHEFLEQVGAGDTSYSQTKFSRDDLGGMGMERDYMIFRGLRPGEISNAAQSADLRGNVLSKIIKMLEIIPAHPASLKTDYLEIEEMALMDKQIKEFDDWLNSKIAGMYVRVEPEYRDGDFQNKNWIK